MVYEKTNKNSFFGIKSSKLKHMYLNIGKDLEGIFIGSSRTEFNISSDAFKKNGLYIYNLGMSCMFLPDYPFMIEHISETRIKPKWVAISILPTALYKGSNSIPYEPTFSDFKALTASGHSPIILAQTIIKKLQRLHAINYFAEPIYNRLIVPLEQFKFAKFIEMTVLEDKIDKKNFDCAWFSREMFANRMVYHCNNGDGILLGNNINGKVKSVILTDIEIEKINLLVYLINILKKNNIKTVLVFEPILNKKYYFNSRKIHDYLNIEIIDLSNIKINEKLWADNEHLNNLGRIQYSILLAKRLNELKNQGLL